MGFPGVSSRIVAASSRIFRTAVSPMTVARKISRLLQKEQTNDTHGHPIVPNYLIVAFSAKDRQRYGGAEETLRRQLIEVAHNYAREKGLGFTGPLSIDFATNPSFRNGRCDISGEFRDAPIGDEAVLVTSDGLRVSITTPQVLGRNDDCGVVLAGSNVSRHHAEIRADQHGLFIVDLGSTNGTMVNGIAINNHRLLHADIVTIGDHELRVEVI
ncbi:MAG TPA: hypothetical protein DCX77_06155 [Acidimicrobiaceae bacterium]|nr:hypothetical protein [Acidimicrobiaceae bacterium]